MKATFITTVVKDDQVNATGPCRCRPEAVAALGYKKAPSPSRSAWPATLSHNRAAYGDVFSCHEQGTPGRRQEWRPGSGGGDDRARLDTYR